MASNLTIADHASTTIHTPAIRLRKADIIKPPDDVCKWLVSTA
jgi:hypothetical protein